MLPNAIQTLQGVALSGQPNTFAENAANSEQSLVSGGVFPDDAAVIVSQSMNQSLEWDVGPNTLLPKIPWNVEEKAMGTEKEQAIIDEFGELVILYARDTVCRSLIELLAGNMEYTGVCKEHLAKCRELVLTAGQRLVLQEVIGDLIDGSIRGVLWILYSREVELIFTSKSGQKLDLVKASDGLHGDFGFSDDPNDTGWVNTFSEYDQYLRLRSGNRSENE